MGVIVPEDEATVTFVLNCTGSSKDITWSVGVKELVGGATPSEAAEQWYNYFGGDTAGMENPYDEGALSDQWTFVGVSVMLMTSTGPLVGQYFNPYPGTDNSEPMPLNCALLCTKATALGGRKYRGRAYLPPCNTDEAGVDAAGNLNPVYLAAVQDRYDHAFGSAVVDLWVPCLHHSDGSAGTPITSFTIGGLIATQRRRLR